jgi:hypothetical protein
MNNGIKKKLEELMGKEVGIRESEIGVSIFYPSLERNSNKILRFEEEDCVVFDRGIDELFVSIDRITTISIKKK